MGFHFTKLKCIILLPLISLFTFLIGSSVLTPYFTSKNLLIFAEFFNTIPSYICHQLPSRCYFLFGSNLALCSRCFAFFACMLIFSLFYLFIKINLKRHIRLFIFYSLITPLVIDGMTQFIHLRTSTNFIRSVTGFMAGLGVSIILIPVYYEKMSSLFTTYKNK